MLHVSIMDLYAVFFKTGLVYLRWPLVKAGLALKCRELDMHPEVCIPCCECRQRASGEHVADKV